MAVDIAQISTVYDSLEAKVKATLDEQWNNGRLTGSDYAQVLSSTLTQAMQLAVQSVQNQPEIDAKIAETNAQTALLITQESEAKLDGVAKRSEIDAQTALLGSQKAKVDSDKLIAETQSANDTAIKSAQKDLIIQQHSTEVQRTGFVMRQTSAYDDKLRIEEAKQLANIMGMFGAGGTALPPGLETTTMNAINAITP